MTRKNKNKNKSKQNPPKPKQKKATPFGDVGGIIGNTAGKFLGYPQLQGVGRWLGSGIGSIFGSGDYVSTGPRPSYNVFAGQTPKFSSTKATNIVCHREYLGDILGSTAFQNIKYPLNPGMDKTFPWLSNIAVNYQQYRFHGLIFEFRPLITDFVTGGAPGVVCIATNYNADQQAFGSRQEAENSEFAVSTKPTQGLVHMIECSPVETANKLYNIRSAAVPTGQDLRTYDYGQTQFMSQNNVGNGVLGELWVSYCVEFFKPITARLNNFTESNSLHGYRSGVATGAVLGTTTVAISGNLAETTTIAANTLTFTDLEVGVNYKIDLIVYAATSANVTIVAATGFVGFNALNGLTTNNAGGPSPTSTYLFSILDTATATSGTLTFGGTITGAATVDIFVSPLDTLIK